LLVLIACERMSEQSGGGGGGGGGLWLFRTNGEWFLPSQILRATFRLVRAQKCDIRLCHLQFPWRTLTANRFASSAKSVSQSASTLSTSKPYDNLLRSFLAAQIKPYIY
jgi:hypothetical protein